MPGSPKGMLLGPWSASANASSPHLTWCLPFPPVALATVTVVLVVLEPPPPVQVIE